MPESGRDLGQFRDPWGLLRRMILSGNPTARWVLMQRVVSLLALPIDVLLGPLESRRVRGSPPSDRPLILIVGPPRAGTTLFFQVLARYLDVSFFDNLSALFARAPSIGHSLFGGGDRPADYHFANYDFDSYYGSTAGWRAPNDGFHVWNRWLGAHRYHARQSLSDGAKEDMRSFFATWTARSGKPFLNKNNRNTDCVPLLADALDNAFFLEISRDPVYIVQSLLLAREAIQGRVETGWGLDSEDLEPGASRQTVIDSVCDQVARILTKLEHSAAEVSTRYLRVRYEDFCNDPSSVIKKVLQFIPGAQLRPGADLTTIEPFHARTEWSLPDPELEYIRRRMETQ